MDINVFFLQKEILCKAFFQILIFLKSIMKSTELRRFLYKSKIVESPQITFEAIFKIF